MAGLSALCEFAFVSAAQLQRMSGLAKLRRGT